MGNFSYRTKDTYEPQRRAASGGRLAKFSRQTARQDEAAEWNATGSRPSASPSLPADSTRGKQYSEESSIIDILNLSLIKEEHEILYERPHIVRVVAIPCGEL